MGTQNIHIRKRCTSRNRGGVSSSAAPVDPRSCSHADSFPPLRSTHSTLARLCLPSTRHTALEQPETSARRTRWAWYSYDFGNTTIEFAIPLYLTIWIVSDLGVQAWVFGLASAVSSWAIGLSGPYIGVSADEKRTRRLWFTVAMLAATVLLGSLSLLPHSGIRAASSLMLVVAMLGNYAFQLTSLIYNASMLSAAERRQRGERLVAGHGAELPGRSHRRGHHGAGHFRPPRPGRQRPGLRHAAGGALLSWSARCPAYSPPSSGRRRPTRSRSPRADCTTGCWSCGGNRRASIGRAGSSPATSRSTPPSWV